ncbi:DUF2247 family protein [Methylomonas sp. SURF-2]|uniref:DUF2247 family protein n=1 Tax=Methylomonas subterranea TaxID=2952225 RepID=A0ABT1THS9_9GAMM|nr:DUF2247 family protein [Methylomonas sp. SURF-2]MCQ8105008.1 DUF2247 family protein [Methylomonas sp. SURF-2]
MSAFEMMKRANLLEWHTLLVGLEHGWCEKSHLIKYAEECLRQVYGEIDGDLISIVIGESIPDDELISVCLRFIEAYGKPLSQEKKDEALEKWRFAHLSSLLESQDSDEEKINALQELYSQFGFPEDMASCSIYNCDGIDPLDAAQNVVQKLAQKIT